MCGIAGIASIKGRSVTQHELKKMCNAMTHRGPNDEGYYIGATVGLGMRRLSIIDLESGGQPVRNEDGTIWVVLNGEIYNYRELRNELKKAGHKFYTSSDTETIVHLYEQYGDQCIEKLRGMFCFALWDDRKKKLLLARDRIGIKPLYYAIVNGRLVFASELKVILQLREIKKELNWQSVNHLFAFLTTPSTESIVAGVHKLEPGHLLEMTAGSGVRKRKYWNLQFTPDQYSDENSFITTLREELEESVRMHLASDVPIGAFLSGGIDSSAVVAMMTRVTDQPVKTFSVGFSEKEYDESKQAAKLAEYLGTEHHEHILEPDITGMMDDIAWHLDEPFGDPSAIPTFLVSKMASQHVSVVLSGDGGDELFGGYDKYVVESRERHYQRMAAPVRRLFKYVSEAMPEGTKGKKFLKHFSMTDNARYLDAVTFFSSDQQQKLMAPDILKQIRDHDVWETARELLSRESQDWLSSLQYFDFQRYLPLDILTKVDRMSMAHSIETRVPLLDHKFVEFATGIPSQLKLRNGNTKYIFKEAMRGILPDEVLDRPKKGFGVPLGKWFRGQLSSYLREYLLSDRCKQRGFLDTKYVEKLIALHENGRPLDLQLWTLLSFELWCRTFLDEKEQSIPDFPERRNVVFDHRLQTNLSGLPN